MAIVRTRLRRGRRAVDCSGLVDLPWRAPIEHRRPPPSLSLGACALIAALASPPVAADTIRIGVADLATALEASATEPDALRRTVLERIRARFDGAGFGFSDGSLLFAATLEGERFTAGCNRTDVRTLAASVRLAGDSELALTLDSLHDPIRVALDIDARVEARGRARQRLALDLFGRCRGVASDTFTFTASGPLELALAVELVLAPRVERGTGVIELRPGVTVSGALERFDLALDVDDSLLERSLERVLRRRITDALDAERVGESIAALQADAEAALDAELEGGVLRIELADPDDEQLRALVARLSPDATFPLPLSYARANAPEILASLILGDDARVAELLGRAAICEAATLLQVPLPHPPLHAVRDAGCTAVRLAPGGTASNGPPVVDGERLHADAACQRPLEVVAEDVESFCRTVLDDGRLGNAGVDAETLDTWALSPGTRFDILARPLAGETQPLTRRVLWKSVETDQGLCELGMRIHTLEPDGGARPSARLRPLLAFHGGSWQRRSSGFLGIESMAARFVAEGFVVFAPFHRLIGTDEGNVECNGATLDAVLADADDALDWVLGNAATYGASGPPVVFGQSSGGHLAASLAVGRPDAVARAVLFYAPLDFGDFVRELRAGDYRSEAGRRTLERVVGGTLETLAADDPLVVANSFPEQVARARARGRRVPPMFLLHGEADELLPVGQSARMCDALGGDPDAGPAARALATAPQASGSSTPAPRRIVTCDAAGSELHLIAEGRHALDLCIADGLCLAGPEASATSVADATGRMLEWIGESDAPDEGDVPDGNAAVGGASAPVTVDDATAAGAASAAADTSTPPRVETSAASAVAVDPAFGDGGGGGAAGWLALLVAGLSGAARRARRPPGRRTACRTRLDGRASHPHS